MLDDDILFWEIDWFDAVLAQKASLEKAVLATNPKVIQVDSLVDLANDFCERFSLVPPTLHLDKVEFSQKEVDVDVSSGRRSFDYGYAQRAYERGTEVTVRLPFTVDEGMLKLKPKTFTTNIPYGCVSHGSVYHRISGVSLNKERLKEAVEGWLKSMEEWIGFQHQSVGNYPEELREHALRHLRARKEKLEADNDLISGLGYKTA